MERVGSVVAARVALLFCCLPMLASAQAGPVDYCADQRSDPIAGNVVFEPGAAPPAQAKVRFSFEGPHFVGTQCDVVVSAPDYRFEFRLPLGSAGLGIRLVDLPAPWLDDQGLDSFTMPQLPRSGDVQLRSVAGVPVTATFRYPEGTVAPPPFEASVRRSTGDRWFTPVRVSDGQFTFYVRRGTPFAISASPPGFGNVLAEFPGRTEGHSVVVDVDRMARPESQWITLLEGSDSFSSSGYPLALPIRLAERGPSGGGRIPYELRVADVTTVRDELRLSSAGSGRGQRVAFATGSLVRNDDVAKPNRTARIQFVPTAEAAPPVPDIEVTVLDDDQGDLPPVLTVKDSAPSTEFSFRTRSILRRAEGGRGEPWLVVLELDKPAPLGGAEVMVDTFSALDVNFPNPFREITFLRAPAVAIDGVDFQALRQRVVFAPGARSATVRIDGVGNDRVDLERYLYLAFTNPLGLVPRDPTVELRIINDDVDGQPAARRDLLPVTPLPRAQVLDILANDVLPPSVFSAGAVTIVEPPRLGTAVVDARGTIATGDDRLLYTPVAGKAGQVDRLRYRVCGVFDEVCVMAWVDVPIRPVPESPMTWAPGVETGFRDVVFSGLPALRDARVDVLAQSIRMDRDSWQQVLVNPASRFSPSDDVYQKRGVALERVFADTERTVLVHVAGEPGSDIDLHVGNDANGDGRFSDSELLCTSATAGPVETCLVRFVQKPGPSPATRLAFEVTNAGPATASFRSFAQVLDDLKPLAGLSATAPTRIAEGEAFPVRLAWRNDVPALSRGAIGLVRIRDAGGQALGDLPFLLDLQRNEAAVGNVSTLRPVAMRSGERALLWLPPAGRERRGIFLDVPPGTARLALAFDSRSFLYRHAVISLRRVSLPSSSPDPSPTFAPDDSAVVLSRRLGFEDAEMVVETPAPGRWFMVVQNPIDASYGMNEFLTVTPTLTAATPAPVVRPGGYFNPARSGHGLFLYPAGNDWAGLWYTYTQDGAPVWYYLQGARPGTNGIWTAPIFRSGWNGSRNHLTEVGRATITPTAADAFQFTYVLDGELGSEPFSSFGRGCPSIDGRVVDASGHWFDPARAGAGYSVQLLPNYEFHAVFAYSARGVPRFLVAERNGVGAANETLPLQQLRGFCPLCVRTGNPERSNVGVLRREFVNGQLSRIGVDASFANGTPGGWVVNDAVVPLGGLQGCAAN